MWILSALRGARLYSSQKARNLSSGILRSLIVTGPHDTSQKTTFAPAPPALLPKLPREKEKVMEKETWSHVIGEHPRGC
jgi:hypothetical protein